jgi:hypothetical protein
MKILIVLTSNDRLGDTSEKTAFWLEELAAPVTSSVRPEPTSPSPPPQAASPHWTRAATAPRDKPRRRGGSGRIPRH